MTIGTEEEAEHQLQETIHSHWVLLLVQGLVMIALGIAAIIEPMVATFVVPVFLGCLLLAGGVIGLVAAFASRRILNFRWLVFTALLSIAIGAYLIWRPGVVSLSLAAAIFFGVQGIAQIIVALSHRVILVSWLWILVSGVINFALAGIVLSEERDLAQWALGLMFGINLAMWGFAIAMSALDSRSH